LQIRAGRHPARSQCDGDVPQNRECRTGRGPACGSESPACSVRAASTTISVRPPLGRCACAVHCRAVALERGCAFSLPPTRNC
jgi:hypothetical protein